MADSDSWHDDTDLLHSSGRRSLRTNHLRSPRRNATFRRSMLDDAARDKVQDLTTSLRATSEVLTTADCMLEHYRSINNDQDEEIRRLRSQLDHSTERIQRRRGEQQNKAKVRFANQKSPEPNDNFHDSLKDLENEQRRLTKEIGRDREERERSDNENRRAVKRLEESFQRVEDDLRGSWSERERTRKSREETERRKRAEELARQEAETDRELLSQSVRLNLEKEREIQDLRDQLRDSQKKTKDQELESKVREIYDQERLANKEKKEVGKLLDELKSVKNLMNESANEKRIKSKIKMLESDDEERERSDRERRLLKKLEGVTDKLDNCEKEKKKLEQDLESAVKRLEWTEGGRSTLIKQIEDLNDEMKISGEDKASVLASLRDCRTKLAESELMRERLTSRMDTLFKKIESQDHEKETLLQQLDRLNDKLQEKNLELAEKMEYAKEQEKRAKEYEDKKEELKSRAVETIKDYKIKCKKSEKEVERYKKEAENAKDELRKREKYHDEGTNKSRTLEKELKNTMDNQDRLKIEFETRSKEAEAEVLTLKKRLNSVLDENLKLQETLSSCKEECKILMERQQKLERLDEVTSHSNEELKEGIRDIAGKKSRLEIKLKEEQSLREKLEEAVDAAQEEQAKCKDEVASLYRQLQREREECNLAVKDAEEKMAKTRAESVDEIQECQRRLEKQKGEFEEKLADTKLQLADERSTIKALRKQQEKNGKETENMRTQINRLTEEKISLKQKCDELQHDIETKDELREQDKTKINELETEIRKCHHSLNRVNDEQKDTLEKADANKVYYITELEKQNAALKDISHKNKDLEEKARENQERIAVLQRKISKLTKSLDDATDALQNSMVALVDNQKLLDELYNFRGDQEERDRIHYKYARFQEQVKLLTRELKDAKTTAEEQKKDTQDASNLSARLLESLTQISTPHLARIRKDSYNSTSFLSRSKSKSRDDFGSLDTIFSSSGEDVTHLKEDHNFKTPKRASIRNSHYKRRSARKSTHDAADKD